MSHVYLVLRTWHEGIESIHSVFTTEELAQQYIDRNSTDDTNPLFIHKMELNDKVENQSKLYIAVLDEFPDYMTPTLVAHTVLSAHLEFQGIEIYQKWLTKSYKKCVVRVNQKEFDKISKLPNVVLGHELHTLNAKKACAVVCPIAGEQPNVLKFAKLWKPLTS